MKLKNKLSHRLQSREEGSVGFGLEFFPPQSETALDNFLDRVDRFGELEPTYVDVSARRRREEKEKLKPMEAVEIGTLIQRVCGMETQIRLTCFMTHKEVESALEKARKNGVQNVFCVRGGRTKNRLGKKKKRKKSRRERKDGAKHHFKSSAELVRYVRELQGDYFNISVAGHPGRKRSSEEEYRREIYYLKQKVDAGADIVISQFFFDWSAFESWERDCREAGVRVPIVPGILPIISYQSFAAIVEAAGLHVPIELLQKLEAVKEDDDQVKELGVNLAISFAEKAIARGFPAIHMLIDSRFTMNLERSTKKLLEALGFTKNIQARRSLPYRARENQGEFVRPIFWSLRPHSYNVRTAEWDEFPNGRWGDLSSPAFGDPTSSLCNIRMPELAVRRSMWAIDAEEDKRCRPSYETLKKRVRRVFMNYLRKDGGVAALPWCSASVGAETAFIQTELCQLIERGLLTINSQPRVNGLPSDHPAFGWGGKGGSVYQKAYVEFFLEKQIVRSFLMNLKRKDELLFHAIDKEGKSLQSEGSNDDDVTAVTWGVFPDREILQPTVVDARAFHVWKDEAFQLWCSQWSSIYPKGSMYKEFLESYSSDLVLVNVVDNNIIDGRLFDDLRDAADAVTSQSEEDARNSR